jgi:hypothetical protein
MQTKMNDEMRVHCRIAERAPNPFGESVTQVNGSRNQNRAQCIPAIRVHRHSEPSGRLAPIVIATEIEPSPTVKDSVSG